MEDIDYSEEKYLTSKSAVEGYDQISSQKLERWAEIRHRQVENKDLIYIAHQLDLLGKVQRQ